MTPRYYPRAVVQASAVFHVGGRLGDALVLDLTVPGCLLESPCPPHRGDTLTLRVSLPPGGPTFRVALGVVRWVQGRRFGVEFLEMAHSERLRYNATVRTLLHQQTAQPAPARASHPPSGVNWHLDTYGVTPPPSAPAGAGRRTR